MLGGVYPNKGPGSPWIVKFPGVFRRFKDRAQADRFLTGLRYFHIRAEKKRAISQTTRSGSDTVLIPLKDHLSKDK
jgi:hypothetical protein